MSVALSLFLSLSVKLSAPSETSKSLDSGGMYDRNAETERSGACGLI